MTDEEQQTIDDSNDENLNKKICPNCKSDNVDKFHHSGSFALPECWFWICNECEHQFDIG